MLSAWLLPLSLLAAGLAVVLGGIIAVRVADLGGTVSSWLVGLVSATAIGLATIGFISGFLTTYDLNICWFEPECASDKFNAKLFAIIAGCVPSLCAAIGSLIVAALPRRAT